MQVWMLSSDINICTVPDYDKDIHYICELNSVTGTNIDKRVHNINLTHSYACSYIPVKLYTINATLLTKTHQLCTKINKFVSYWI